MKVAFKVALAMGLGFRQPSPGLPSFEVLGMIWRRCALLGGLSAAGLRSWPARYYYAPLSPLCVGAELCASVGRAWALGVTALGVVEVGLSQQFVTAVCAMHWQDECGLGVGPLWAQVEGVARPPSWPHWQSLQYFGRLS